MEFIWRFEKLLVLGEVRNEIKILIKGEYKMRVDI